MSEKFNKNDAKKPSDFKKRRFNRNKHKPPIGEGYTPSGSKEALDTPVENLGLRPQTLEILLKGGIKRCFDIAVRTEREMFKIQNLGRKHCNEIEGKIKSLGLCLRPDERNNKPLKDFNKVAQEQKNPQQNISHDQPKNHEKDSGGLRNGGLGQRVKPKFIPDEPPKKEPETFIKFSKNKKWGFMDRKGIEITSPEYDEVFPFKEGFACVEKDGLFGYIDTDGKPVTEFIYDCALSFNEGYACVTKNDKSGLINTEGEIILPLEYEAVTPVEEGRAKVKKDGKWFNIFKDEKGKFIAK